MPRGKKQEAQEPTMTRNFWHEPTPLPKNVEYVDIQDIQKDKRARNSSFTWDGAIRMIKLYSQLFGVNRFTKPVQERGMWIHYYESTIALR